MPDVLLIEDDEQVRCMLVVALEGAGFTVAAAEDGRQGLALFRESPARVVVTDLFMPKVDGLEVIQVLRRLAPGVKHIGVGRAPSERHEQHRALELHVPAHHADEHEVLDDAADVGAALGRPGAVLVHS